MRTKSRHFLSQIILMIALLGVVAGDAAAQAWFQTIDKPQRFSVLKDFDAEAVLSSIDSCREMETAFTNTIVSIVLR